MRPSASHDAVHRRAGKPYLWQGKRPGARLRWGTTRQPTVTRRPWPDQHHHRVLTRMPTRSLDRPRVRSASKSQSELERLGLRGTVITVSRALIVPLLGPSPGPRRRATVLSDRDLRPSKSRAPGPFKFQVVTAARPVTAPPGPPSPASRQA